MPEQHGRWSSWKSDRARSTDLHRRVTPLLFVPNPLHQNAVAKALALFPAPGVAGWTYYYLIGVLRLLRIKCSLDPT